VTAEWKKPVFSQSVNLVFSMKGVNYSNIVTTELMVTIDCNILGRLIIAHYWY
jgi:hypothetical protein